MLPNGLRKPDDGLVVPKVPSDEWIPRRNRWG
jgi:hypothetical protein